MIIALFLAILALTLAFGAYLGQRLTRSSARIDGWVADDERAEQICDAADMATDGEERVIGI